MPCLTRVSSFCTLGNEHVEGSASCHDCGGHGAVPMTVFALDYMVRYPACSVTDVAARELATVSIADYDGAEFGDFRAGFGEPEEAGA